MLRSRKSKLLGGHVMGSILLWTHDTREFKLRAQTSSDKRRTKTNFTLVVLILQCLIILLHRKKI